MPAHIIAAARSSGGAGRSASHVVTHAAFGKGLPALLLETREVSRERTRLALVPPLVVELEDTAKLIAKNRLSDMVITYIEEPDEGALRSLLPLADTVTIAGDCTGNLDDAAKLYGVVAGLEIAGASGRTLRPWLLPSGWPRSIDPGIRLRGWRAQLERRAFPGRLRCMPLVFPWSDLGSVLRAHEDRLGVMGASLIEHLAAIADGGAPSRPAEGLAGGDPWPDLQPSAPVVHLSGIRAPRNLVQGA
jgi:hypothetical protein